MQRYRINYTLLFGLTAVFVVVGGLAFFLIHPWQVNRNAEWFRERADAAIAEKDVRTAYDYQSKYVRYRKDEADARVKLANLAIEVTELGDVTSTERGIAYTILQDAVLKTSDTGLRRKLADMLIAGGRPGDAVVHIDELLRDEPGNSELQALRVRSLFATKDFSRASQLAYDLIGYDESSDTFDVEKASAADQPEIYSLLAATLADVNKKPRQARQVIDQMVTANPESYDAYLKRSVFRQITGEKEAAAEDLAKAYELNPTDANVLRLMGQVALVDKDYDKAQQHLTEGLNNNPQVIVLYKLLALTEMRRGNFTEALEVLDRGIKEFGPLKSFDLIIYKIDALFQNKDIAGVKKEIGVLEDLDRQLLEPLIDFQRARIVLQNRQWAEAANEFKRLRPLLIRFKDAQILAGVMLGGAYEQLGQHDLATQAYEAVLQTRPNDPQALAGRQRIASYGRPAKPDSPIGLTSFTQLTQQMLALPEELQDWEAIDDRIKEYVADNELAKSIEYLYQAQVFLDREMYDDAREKIRAAAKLDENNLSVELAAVKLMWLEPHTSVEDALTNLDRIEKKYGDSIHTRTLHAEIIAKNNGEKAAENLRALAEGIDDWDDRDKVRFYVTLGRKLVQLGQLDTAYELWNLAAQVAPNNLPVRMQLFDVALQRRDDVAMKAAQDKILELVQSKDNASYIITEVKRRIIAFGKQEVTREELLEARALLDVAMQQRPKWNELHVIYGQLLLILQQDFDLALERLNDALKYGPPNMKVIALHVQLLAGQGRYQEAREKMQQMPSELQESMLGQVGAQVLLETGDKETAFAIAEKLVEQQAQSVATQKWFAKLAARAGQFDAAAEAWNKALELNPIEPDSWSQLMILYAQQRKNEDLQRVIRSAKLALDAEYIPFLTAKTYELQGRWRNAEHIYLSIYGDQLDEVRRAKRMVEFYLLWRSVDPANIVKAGSFLNRILRASYEGKVSEQDKPNVVWARRQAARLMAGAGDYHKSRQAIQLLMQNATDGKLPVEDLNLQSEILASLKDPSSQTQAVQILSNLRQQGQLDKKGTITLAKLMHATGDWKGSEDLILDSLASSAVDLELRATYISLLIEHGEHDLAQSRLNRIKNSSEDNTTYLQLLARLSFKKGDRTGVNKALRALLPDNLDGSLESNQLVKVRSVAILASEYEDLELAEELYKRYIKGAPTAAYELTRFYALFGNTDLAVEQMQQVLARLPDAVVALAAQMLRKRRTEFGDKYDEVIDRFIATALRDDPDSAHRLLTHAEILEIQQKYDESIAAYDNLLKRDDAPERQLAAASNNLAFILALRGQRLDEAETLVNQSIEFYGPLASLLDTRGVVRIAKQQYDLAIEDLSQAANVDRQPLTIYHLAKALLLAGDDQAALERWKEAQKQGLERDDVPELEQAAYDEFASKIQQL